MFGHDKHDDDKEEVVQPVDTQPVNEGLLGVDDSDDATGAPTTDDVSTNDDVASVSGAGLVTDDDVSDVSVGNSTDSDDASNDSSSASATDSNDLLDIKRQALQELSPLVDHLDQSPEEKFKTTMMMIQATDDKALLPAAFGAAKEIADDKARAQALLDVINEINYFTQPKKD